MEDNKTSIIEKVFNNIKASLDTKTIVGEPVTINDATIIPLIEITCGVGIGDFEDKNAGGIATKLTPCALCVIQNGITKVIHIKNTDPLTKLIELLPDLINDVVGQNNISQEIKKQEDIIKKKYININDNN